MHNQDWVFEQFLEANDVKFTIILWPIRKRYKCNVLLKFVKSIKFHNTITWYKVRTIINMPNGMTFNCQLDA